MLSSEQLKKITTEARPIIRQQLELAEKVAGFRDVVSAAGGDWGQLKALIKAQIQDEDDDAGDGKRVKKILDRADYAQAYADMLGLGNLNEQNYSAELSDEDVEAMRDTARRIDARNAAEAVTAREEINRSGPETGASGVVLGADEIDPDTGEIIEHEIAPLSTDPVEQRDQAEGVPAEPASSADQSTAARMDVPNVRADTFPADHTHPEVVRQQSGGRDAATAGTQAPPVDTLSAAGKSAEDAGASSAVPSRMPRRDHCLRPEVCASMTRHHCHSCEKAHVASLELIQ